MKRTDYIAIQAPMVTNLKLSGNNLIIFALIHGFCKDGNHNFTGSLEYISEWTNLSKPTIIATLKLLVKSGLLNKEEKIVNNIKFCSYTTNYDEILNSSIDSLLPLKKYKEGSKDSKPNIIINKIDNKEEIDKSISKKNDNVEFDVEDIVRAWNGLQATIRNISKITKVTDLRKRKVKNLLKSCSTTPEELIRFISTLPYADDWVIGKGKGDRSWIISFDWLISNTSNWFVRGLEGEMHKKNIVEFRKIMDGTDSTKAEIPLVEVKDGSRNAKGEVWSEQLHRWLK